MACNHPLMQSVERYLKENGLSRSKFAHKLEMQVGQLSNLIKGKSLPTLPTLRRISALTGIPAGILCEEALDKHVKYAFLEAESNKSAVTLPE